MVLLRELETGSNYWYQPHSVIPTCNDGNSVWFWVYVANLDNSRTKTQSRIFCSWAEKTNLSKLVVGNENHIKKRVSSRSSNGLVNV